MRLRLRRPGDLARTLRAIARRRPEEVEDYLEEHSEQWSALAGAMPGDAADILEAISEEVAGDLITELDPEEAAGLIEELRDDLAAELLVELPVGTAADVLAEMPPEEAADVLAAFEDQEHVETLLDVMEDAAADEIRQLLAFAPDSAGGLMTTDIAVLPVGLTAGEAIERLRSLNEELEDLSYVYVVDELGRLEGVLSFRELVFKRPGVGLDEVMVRDPLSVHTSTDREVVAEMIQRYHLFGLPVVDDEGRLVGMVTTESVIEAVQQEASEDFAASVGAGIGETVYTGVGGSVRARLPWLGLNLLLALVVAFVIEHQTGLISREPLLAAFMPVIAGLGGNGGQQSLAVVIRTMATGDLPSSRSWEVLRRQAGIGLLNGISLAVTAGLVASGLVAIGVFQSNVLPAEMGTVVAVAALANLTIATTAGTIIPLILRRFGLDPALASSIFLTLTTDLVGFGGFLLVAGLLLP
jgi:magnesium transporter